MKPTFLKIALSVPDWGTEEIQSIIEHFLNNSKNSIGIISSLEKRICSVLKVQFCIATNMGREALYIALCALGLQKGDGVILPSFTCGSILHPILSLGGIPQFVDIGSDLNIDPISVKESITAQTKIIIMPHLFGKSAQVASIMEIAQEKKLFLVDDAAQALGGKYGSKYLGTMGDFGILSFGPFKGIMATRGGALLTDSKELYQRAKEICLEGSGQKEALKRFMKYYLKFRMRKYTYFLVEEFRKHGKRERNQVGYTEPLLKLPLEKMSEIDAGIAVCQLDKLNETVNRRKGIARRLLALIRDIKEIDVPFSECDNHVFSKFIILVNSGKGDKYSTPAESLVAYLRVQGIEAEPWCYIPLHLNKAYFDGNVLKNTEMMWKNVVGLPIHTKMADSDISYMARVLRKYFE